MDRYSVVPLEHMQRIGNDISAFEGEPPVDVVFRVIQRLIDLGYQIIAPSSEPPTDADTTGSSC